MKQLLATSALALMGFVANGQLLETMGTVGSGTQTISARETAGNFDLVALTYVGTADMRITTPSTGYPGASGGFNTLIQAQESFEMQGINAAGCKNTDSIRFGINKNTNAATGIDYLVLEYSNDNGTSWSALTYPALPTGTGTSKWYKTAAALPAGAHVPNLRIRFRSTLAGTSSSNPQYRIDDISMTCGSTTSCGVPTASINVSGATVVCAGATMPQLTTTTGITEPYYQWYNQDGAISGAQLDAYSPTTSGTYYVIVSSEDGCEATTQKVYVHVYPQVQYCPITLEGCVKDIVQACAKVKAQDLIFSQYVEGSGFNKYVEIFNGTCSDVDLTGYELRAYHNGASTAGAPTYTIALSGTLVAGDVFVIAHPTATAWSGTADLTSANLQFNGDDALVLFNLVSGNAADIFGSVGNDPGSAWRDADSTSTTYRWSTENKTLVRKACVYAGITVNPDLAGIGGFPTLITEWDTLSVDSVVGLGAHTFGASSYSYSVASGTALIKSTGDNCANIEVGSVNSVINVVGTFCGFNNCNATPGQIAVNVNCNQPRDMKSASAVEQSSALELFPNPTTGSVMLNFNTTTDEEVSVVLFDLSGKAQMTLQNGYLLSGTHRMQADLSNLAAGTYIIRIASASENQTLRVVKAEK
ncbi:hypothetical protein D3C71_1082880 [compost metagenome]